MKPIRADRTIRVAAPNRVDVAGGTLDIYPLYLLVPDAMTVNAAIDVGSHVELRPSPGGARLVSGNFAARARARDTHGFSTAGRFGLLAGALRARPAVTGVTMVFRNEAPVGSGIGASSALLVAALLALDSLHGTRRPWEETAREAMEIEAAHLGSLTGRQDHIAALRGGIQGIRFLPGRTLATRIGVGSLAARRFAAHGFLAGTGRPHRSSDVNWRMIRGAIEGDEAVRRKFASIAAAARDAWEAVRDGDAVSAGRAMAREWAVRKTLAPGVTIPLVEETLASGEFRARVAGAKLCGAGGGGFLFGLLRNPAERPHVMRLLSRRGFTLHPFRLSPGPVVLAGSARGRR